MNCYTRGKHANYYTTVSIKISQIKIIKASNFLHGSLRVLHILVGINFCGLAENKMFVHFLFHRFDTC